MTVDRTLVVQLNPSLTDGAVRRLRDLVGRTLEARPLRGLELGGLRTVRNLDAALRVLRASQRA